MSSRSHQKAPADSSQQQLVSEWTPLTADTGGTQRCEDESLWALGSWDGGVSRIRWRPGRQTTCIQTWGSNSVCYRTSLWTILRTKSGNGRSTFQLLILLFFFSFVDFERAVHRLVSWYQYCDEVIIILETKTGFLTLPRLYNEFYISYWHNVTQYLLLHKAWCNTTLGLLQYFGQCCFTFARVHYVSITMGEILMHTETL